MKRLLALVSVSFSLIACNGAIGIGASGPNATGTATGEAIGAAGTDPAGPGAAGTGVVATGAAGTGVVATGSAGTGVVATGTAGTGVIATGTGTGGTSAPACGSDAIPADVAAVISAHCVACHGTPPITGVPSSLATYAALTAPSTTEPTKSVAAVAVERVQPGAAKPMPPSGLTPISVAEAATLQNWVTAGTPPATCADGGVSSDAGGIVDPYSTPVVCTSKTMWTRGTEGSGSMEPGQACIACHSRGEGPGFALAGTVYPTAHEPDNCNGGSTTAMASVVITGADGQVITLTPNQAGNFSYRGTIATPYKAKVTMSGRERAMVEAQTSGDCNSCHTEMGAMLAPGRIMLP
jgi:hypothetical protein